MMNSFGSKTGVTDTYYNSNDLDTYDVLEDYVDSELKEMIYVAYNIKTGKNNASITAYLEENGLEFLEAEVQMVPTTTVKLDEKDAERMENFLEKLDDLDDVSSVYHNWEE